MAVSEKKTHSTEKITHILNKNFISVVKIFFFPVKMKLNVQDCNE